MSVTLLPRTRQPSSWLGRLVAGRRVRLAGGYRWSEAEDPAQRYDAFRLLINIEQRPRRENRVVLSDEHDALGQRRAALHWRWSAEEQDSLVRLRWLVAGELESAGIGHVEIDHARRPDPNAHHHAGTTRMAESPRHGVVDRDCRVFGVDNLYVAGASVLPTAGFANPTLTIVAMASRLASHLRDRLGA
jgi:choline dehydrogenase-like flavoprotein